MKMSLARFLEANPDDILHNSIYQLLTNIKFLQPAETKVRIFNLNDVPAEHLATIIRMFEERKAEIRVLAGLKARKI